MDESNDPPPIKRLNGKITRTEELNLAKGTHCEVLVGLWDKGGEEAGRGKVDPEKVRFGLVNSTPLSPLL